MKSRKYYKKRILSLYFVLSIFFICAYADEGINLEESVNCLLPGVVRLASNKDIVKSVSAYNQSSVDVQAIERKWPLLKEDDPVILKLTQSASANRLRHYIEKISMRGEAFVIGLDGGLAAATNKTSDFWQGDEAQFFEAIKLDAGSAKLIDIVADKSADTILVKIAGPVYSAEQDRPIGVLVMGYDALVLDFMKFCKSPSG